MIPFATNLRSHAEALGLSNAEVARRAGLTERRYGNYVTGRREPDLATLVRIAAVLETSIDALLAEAPGKSRAPERDLLKNRLNAAAAMLTEPELALVVVQIEALAARATPK